jgi:3-oxoacyl-[acyl-carrier protein] reductase
MATSETNKTAIVTGSSRGIGRAIAVLLAQKGFCAAVNCSSNIADAQKVVQEIEKAGGRAIAVLGNVADPSAAANIFDQTEKAFGSVDVLVNTAGVIAIKPVADTDDATYDRIMDINVKGTFNMLRQASKRLKDNGRIINFSTSALVTNMAGYAIYNASKAAVEAMTRTLSKELAPRKITVNAVAPGAVATELFFQGKTHAFVDQLIRMIPLGRIGEVDDIAPIVAFLASPESGWVSGQILRVNGAVG